MCWASANLVPVGADEPASAPSPTASVAGAATAPPSSVPPSRWASSGGYLAPSWGPARAVRPHQPLMSTMTAPVRPRGRARPAGSPGHGRRGRPRHAGGSAHVHGGDRLPALHRQRPRLPLRPAGPDRPQHTYVVIEDDEVIFKADVGSVALGCAQIQGVWLAPRLRGQGLAVPAMAAVVEQVMAARAPGSRCTSTTSTPAPGRPTPTSASRMSAPSPPCSCEPRAAWPRCPDPTATGDEAPPGRAAGWPPVGAHTAYRQWHEADGSDTATAVTR